VIKFIVALRVELLGAMESAMKPVKPNNRNHDAHNLWIDKDKDSPRVKQHSWPLRNFWPSHGFRVTGQTKCMTYSCMSVILLLRLTK